MCENTSQRITEEHTNGKIISAERNWKKGRIRRERKTRNLKKKRRKERNWQCEERLQERRTVSAPSCTATLLCCLLNSRFWSRGNLTPYRLTHCKRWLYLHCVTKWWTGSAASISTTAQLEERTGRHFKSNKENVNKLYESLCCRVPHSSPKKAFRTLAAEPLNSYQNRARVCPTAADDKRIVAFSALINECTVHILPFLCIST